MNNYLDRPENKDLSDKFMEDFADAPISIGEIRSDKSTDSKDWTVRDMLITVLRQIDKGELELDHAVLSYGLTGVSNQAGGYYLAGSAKLCIAEMEATKHSLLQGTNK